MNYALENPYRPAHELRTVIACTVALPILTIVPLGFTSKVLVMGTVTVLGIIRFLQALRIRKYHKNLAVLKRYELSSRDIPVSPLALFLGKGFKWDQRHTQRLYLARQPKYRHLSQPSWLYKVARNLEIHHPKSMLSQLTMQDHWFNPVRPRPPVGGDTLQHGVETHEHDIWMDIGERVGHTAVLGTTRVGKTRFLEVVVQQDIRRGDVTITFDPKGDAELLKRMSIEAKRAGRPFYMFHLGYPEYSARYNPIGSFSRITEVATRIANQLPSEGNSKAFKDFVWGYVNVLVKCMEALGIQPTYRNIYSSATNIDHLALQYFYLWLDSKDKNWRSSLDGFDFDEKDISNAKKQGRSPEAIKLASYITQQGYRNDITDAISAILTKDKSYFDKLVSSLYPLLEKLTSGKVAELLSPDTELSDPRPIFNWSMIINTGAVVYVGLDSLSDYEVAGVVGNAMFADLTSRAGQIYKNGTALGQSAEDGKRKVTIHADEFNELIGDEFIPLLNKAGGAGYQVTVYTQTWSDVEAKIGSAAKASQIGGNLNNLIMLRVKNVETAEILTNLVQEADIVTSTQLSGTSDQSNPEEFEDFSTQNEDRVALNRVPMITTADIVSLPKGQAFCLIHGNQLYKIRMPLPKSDDDDLLPESIAKVAEMMVNKHKSYVNDEELTVEGTSYGT